MHTATVSASNAPVMRGASRARRASVVGVVVVVRSSSSSVSSGRRFYGGRCDESHGVRRGSVSMATSTRGKGTVMRAGGEEETLPARPAVGASAPALRDDEDEDEKDGEALGGAGSGASGKRGALPPGPLMRPPLRVAAGLAGFGAIESTYLAIQKLTGGEVACPVGGCQTALNSGYAELFGIPLSAYGATAYALVAALAWWGAGMQNTLVEQGDENRDRDLESSYAKARVLLFFAATGLAGVSSYLLFVLAFKLGGVECLYCLTSAAISLTLFGIGFSGLSSKESGSSLPPAIALYLVTALTMSIVLTEGDVDKSQGLKLAYAPPQLEQQSSAYSRALAKHLADTGAKMYGAFWCSHCIEQKETFGAGAQIPYVECFPDGWERGTPVTEACSAAKVEGFPTWVINGKKLEGEQTLEELAKLSGFEGQNDAASMVAELF
jgi:uncharacterized membrane protein